jgi:hypothetical protein
VLINTPDASDAEIADFVHHKGREIKNPKTSLMACPSAVLVGAIQGRSWGLTTAMRRRYRQRLGSEIERFPAGNLVVHTL